MSLENSPSPHDSVIDLAREADFRLGGLQVSPSTREVERDGQREALEPRVMQVLVALFRANGGVVSRDALIARCWEGRIVGEDAINRAIWRLRKLAEADGDFAIETIPRVGYRLIPGSSGHVSPPVVAEAGSSDPVARPEKAPPAVPGAQPRRWLIAGTLILVGLAGSAAAWLLWPARHWTVESNRPFISTLALESEPAFSPDGTVLAYTVGPDFLSRKIHVRNVAGGDGIKVADDAYDDRSPSWSSDGVHLAYVAIKPGEPCRIMVATIPAGGVRQAARCRRWDVSSVAWQPGTQFLYYSDAPPEAAALRNTGDIYRLDLDTGARRLVTRKEGMDSGGAVGNLHCSPDGKSLLYLWIHGLGVWEIMIHDLASGKEHSLGTIGGDPSAAWSADSRTVFASGATYIESTITAYPVDGAPGYRVYATGVHVRRIAVGGEGLLALETTINRDNLARASPTPAAQPDIIDPAGGITMSPTFAPDGTLAFVSNRSGNNAVWTMKPGAAPVQLYDGGASFLARLRYSPDGKKLALVVGSGTGVTIKILNADGASLSSFGMLRVGIGLPGWTPDSKDVLILERRDNRVYRINAENPAQRRPIAPPFWFGVTIRGDAIYGTRADGPGLWRIDKKPELISGKFPTYWQPGFAILGDEALIPDFSAPGGPRILAQPLAGGPDRVLAYAPGAATQANFQSAIAVNPKTGEIVYVAAVARDSNVDLLTLTKR